MYNSIPPRPQRSFRIGSRVHTMPRSQVGSERIADRLDIREGSNARNYQQMSVGPPPHPHHHHHPGGFNPPMSQSYEARTSFNSHNRGYPIPNQMPAVVSDSPLLPSHEENVRFVHEDWIIIDSKYKKSISNPDGSAGQVQYYQEKVPNSQLDGFQPFDFDQWYANNSIRHQ